MFFVLLILSSFLVDHGFGQESCRTPNGGGGNCILLETCTPLLDIKKKSPKTQDDIMYLRQAGCGLHLNIKPKVCCPPKSEWADFTPAKPVSFPLGGDRISDQATTATTEPAVTRPKPQQQGTTLPPFPDSTGTCPETVQAPDKDSLCCGKESTSAVRIVGGKLAGIDQYPWLALIEYDSGATACGGALVSSRYVVTAAHCMGRTSVGTPVRVRLSEYNTTSYPTDIVEADGGGFEKITVLVVAIEKQIIHPDFHRENKTPKNDIGLLKLTRNVPYTELIRPICLPFEDASIDPQTNLRFSVAGWGSNGTVFSEVKQHVLVPHVPLDACQLSYLESRSMTRLDDTQMCAGGERGKDSCSGDSGGPLMHELGDTFVLVGVVSFGDKMCGKEGKPAVYTSVYKFLDWMRGEMV